jgi:hypothetical protein
VRRRGPALEVLFSAFALNGIRKMNPLARMVRSWVQRYTSGKSTFKGISAWDGETKESLRT